MPKRICTACRSTFEPKPETFGIWATFVLGILFFPVWIATAYLYQRRNRCTECECGKTVLASSPAGKELAKRA